MRLLIAKMPPVSLEALLLLLPLLPPLSPSIAESIRSNRLPNSIVHPSELFKLVGTLRGKGLPLLKAAKHADKLDC